MILPKNKLKPIYFIFICFFFLGFTVDRNEFYKILSGKTLPPIDNYILKLEKQKKTSKNNAYWGALTAKKANFEKGAPSKIKTFKAGINSLEQEISNYPNNVEYRFLRLSIQEHCPKILRYNKNIKEDALIISTNFSNQTSILKKIIKNYAQESNGLDAKLLK
jgi:hypothetical protein